MFERRPHAVYDCAFPSTQQLPASATVAESRGAAKAWAASPTPPLESDATTRQFESDATARQSESDAPTGAAAAGGAEGGGGDGLATVEQVGGASVAHSWGAFDLNCRVRDELSRSD
jgi:hypothetical protein